MPRLKNLRRERFCREYVRSEYNGAKAARAVGCYGDNARAQGAKWLAIPSVLERVQELNENILDGLAMEMEEAVARVANLARFNLQDLYDDAGRLIPIHELPEEVAAGVNEIEMVDGETVKVKGGKDVRAALDMILKNRNWYEEHQSSGKGEVHIHITGKDEQL